MPVTYDFIVEYGSGAGQPGSNDFDAPDADFAVFSNNGPDGVKVVIYDENGNIVDDFSLGAGRKATKKVKRNYHVLVEIDVDGSKDTDKEKYRAKGTVTFR